MKNRRITRLALIRHAQTRWNRQGRIQGQADSPLTEYGRRQIEAWVRTLGRTSWDRILSSDLGRARDTARRINRSLNRPETRDPRLREMDWGRWTGRLISDIREPAEKMIEGMESGWGFRPPGGEDRLELWERAGAALAEAARRWPGQTILVVCHGGVIAAVIHRLLGRSYIASEPALVRNGHLHWLASDGADLRIEKANALDLANEAQVETPTDLKG